MPNPGNVGNGLPFRTLSGWRRPELRADCARPPAAEVVVINPHNDEERPQAESSRAKILELYRELSLRNWISFNSRVIRPDACIANLLDDRDARQKSAIAQIKRKLRGRY